jgi:hypothetical protein|tara:strand:+ start:218 stop:754 length:537 start_codon:yes stop_codon:yes gene_type:complete
MSLTYALSKPIPTEYTRLKKTLKRSTAGYGSVLSASYFITQGADQGVSATLGAMTSYAYITLLSDRVDKFEDTAIQKEFLAPLGAAAFEVSWNHAPFAFDFDYGATFIGFLAYKFALSTVLYETVREMMMKDSESFYDTDEGKNYTNPKDWNDEVFTEFNADEPFHEPHEQPDEENVD